MWNRQQVDDGTEVFVAQGGNSENVERVTRWDVGVEAAFGRGVTTPAITYLRLMQADGTSYYIYVVAGVVTISAVQP